MEIFRVVKKSNFSVMSNLHFQDKRLKFSDMGLLSFLYSKKDTWECTLEGFAACSANGVDSIRSIIKRLIKFGYMFREGRKRKSKGHFGAYIYYVYENPADNPHYDPNKVEDKNQTETETETRKVRKGHARKQSDLSDLPVIKALKKPRRLCKGKAAAFISGISTKGQAIIAFGKEKLSSALKTVKSWFETSSRKSISETVVDNYVENSSLYVENSFSPASHEAKTLSPTLENPTQENPTQLNTEQTNTDSFSLSVSLNDITDRKRNVENSPKMKKMTDRRTYKAVRKKIEKQIEADILKYNNPNDTALINLIVKVITETILSDEEVFRINRTNISADRLKGVMEEIRYEDVEFTICQIKEYGDTIKSPYSYIRTCLYNAHDDLENGAERFANSVCGK